MVTVRKALITDADGLKEAMESAEESGFMLFDPGERQVTTEALGKYIDNINSKTKSVLFVACENEMVLGYVIVQNEKLNRIGHRAYIVAGVHFGSRGKGVGRALFLHVEKWAEKVGLHRLDLTVITGNEAAVNLYRKMGFEIEGTKRDSLLINNKYVDEFYMSKLIGKTHNSDG